MDFSTEVVDSWSDSLTRLEVRNDDESRHREQVRSDENSLAKWLADLLSQVDEVAAVYVCREQHPEKPITIMRVWTHMTIASPEARRAVYEREGRIIDRFKAHFEFDFHTTLRDTEPQSCGYVQVFRRV